MKPGRKATSSPGFSAEVAIFVHGLANQCFEGVGFYSCPNAGGKRAANDWGLALWQGVWSSKRVARDACPDDFLRRLSGGAFSIGWSPSIRTAAIVRGAMENILAPEVVDGIFEEHARRQCERQLVFSTIVEMMCLVVCRMTPAINDSYRMFRESMTASVKSVDNRINNIESEVSRAVVRRTEERMLQIVAELRRRLTSPVPGCPKRNPGLKSPFRRPSSPGRVHRSRVLGAVFRRAHPGAARS